MDSQLSDEEAPDADSSIVETLGYKKDKSFKSNALSMMGIEEGSSLNPIKANVVDGPDDLLDYDNESDGAELMEIARLERARKQ